MTIHKTSRMELISVAYLEAVAASIGAQIGQIRIDNHSVDGTFYGSSSRCPRIDFQLKATHSYDFDADGNPIQFSLPIHNYHHLRSDRCSPTILIVLLMPPIETSWLEHSEDALLIRKCAYWKNLKGAPDTANTSTINVDIAKINVFSPETLQQMLDKADKGLPL